MRAVPRDFHAFSPPRSPQIITIANTTAVKVLMKKTA
jgi:hypothetical protein